MRITIMAGTRPEVVKLAPIIKRLKNVPEVEVSLCASGQHREMLAQAFEDFDLKPDLNLEVMIENQGLSQLSANLLQKLDPVLKAFRPDWLLVQGDTTSAMIAALAGFYKKLKIGHVEAGLRSNDKLAPFPEEINRKIIALVADLHFAPTPLAKKNLLHEGISEEKIFVTGNTVVDSLYDMRKNHAAGTENIPAPILEKLESGKKLIFITAHRRENFGTPLKNICSAVKQISQMRDDVFFVYPVHLNPKVHDFVFCELGELKNVLLFNPMPYKMLVSVLDKSWFVLTDSGGIQEESTVLHRPVLVLRENTERMEGINAGAAKLAGTNSESLITQMTELLENRNLYDKMKQSAEGIYGDGKASERIVNILLENREK